MMVIYKFKLPAPYL